MSRTAVRSRTTVIGAAVLLVGAVVVTAVLLRSGDDSSPTAPYHDGAASGSIGLCDRSGHQVTSGSVTAAPFAWRAVGTTAPPAAYAGAGRTATLYAFQPRAGAEPDEWSGRLLTAAGRYTSTTHPMAAATDADVALQDFLTGYPPQDHGFVQLRLYLGAPDRTPLSTAYDALDISVSGSSWRAVGGARVNCSSGRSVSLETAVDPSHS